MSRHYYGFTWPGKPGVLAGSQRQQLTVFDDHTTRAHWLLADPAHRTMCDSRDARQWLIGELEATHSYAQYWKTSMLLAVWQQEQANPIEG